jgi:type I restriction enzyme S subunit
MTNLNLVKLNTLCDKITDGSHYSPKGTSKGIPMLSVKDMVENGFNYSNCKFISSDDYFDLVRGDCKPLKNDVLIAKDGSYLKHVFVIKKEIDQAVLSSIGILRPNLNKVNPDYLKYYLHTASVKETVSKKYVSGSALPRIILRNFGEIEVIYKKLDEQSKIAKVLSDLDTKIELNNKINTELEAMAKLIYDYWFVQFDFPDKNGKPYKSSGGKMVFNEELKREIPEDWELCFLGDVVNKTGTGLNPRKNFKLGEGDNYYVTIKNIDQGKVILNEKCDRINDEALRIINNRSDLRKGDILYTSIQPVGTTYLIREEPKNWNINESVFTIRPDYEKVTSEFLYMFVSGEYIKKYTSYVSAGSIHKGVRHSTLKECKFILPSKSIVDDFTKLVRPMLDKDDKIQIENQKLAELRDWLLPMLMNGQVRVN